MQIHATTPVGNLRCVLLLTLHKTLIGRNSSLYSLIIQKKLAYAKVKSFKLRAFFVDPQNRNGFMNLIFLDRIVII